MSGIQNSSMQRWGTDRLRPWGKRIGLSVASPGFGESPRSSTVQLSEVKTNTSELSASADETAERGEFAVALYPSVNPTIGNGIIFISAYIRRLNAKDKISPPSVFGFGGCTPAVAAGPPDTAKNYFSSRTGSEYWAALVSPGLTTISPNDIVHNKLFNIKPFTLDIRLAGLEAKVERDTRDSQFYPRHGSVFDLSGKFSEKGLGSDLNYQQYGISYQGYYSFGKRHILAYTASGCAVRNDVPFFDQCMLGSSSDLRGYAVGQHQDRRILVGQAGYRMELPWRFGLVGFVGAGEAARKWADFSSKNLLPGDGLVLRFMLASISTVLEMTNAPMVTHPKSMTITYPDPFCR